MHLGQYMATYLAETITGLFQRVLTHPGRGLVNETNAALLTPKFWVQAIYTELLYASSRYRAVREKEQQRPPNGLVKVVCLPYDGAAEKKHGRIKATDASFETMIGPSSWLDSLFIWFPAAWMRLVVEAIREKSLMHNSSSNQRGAVASADQQQPGLTGAQEFSHKVKRWQVDQSGGCPILQSSVNVEWLTFDCTTKYYSSTTPYYRALLRPLKRRQNDVLPVLLRPYYASTTKASKRSISCEASATFQGTSFQNDRFVRGFLQISKKKLPK